MSDSTAAPLAKVSLGRQLLRREVNERVRTADPGAPKLVLLCECGRPRCLDRFAVSAGTYEDVRRFPTDFLVRTGHEAAEAERLVAEHDGFRVVEKYGAPGLAAIRAQRRKLRLAAATRN